MQIPVLIEPIEGGRYRARAGEPFNQTSEGATPDEARTTLEQLLARRVQNGVQFVSVNVPEGVAPRVPFRADNAYQTDPSFREMQEIIAENRRLEDEAYRQEEESAGS